MRRGFSPGFNWRASSSMSLNVFGRIDQKTMSINTRFNYTMTPTLSLQVYAEPFVSAGEYTNFKELVDGRAANYQDRYRPLDYAGNPDFNIRSFRTTRRITCFSSSVPTGSICKAPYRDGTSRRGDTT